MEVDHKSWGFCITCRQWIDPYGIYLRKGEQTIKIDRVTIPGGKKIEGVEIKVEEYSASCVYCGNDIYVGTISDMNALIRETAAFRKAVEIEKSGGLA